jgi:hypothetical protein
LLRINLKMNNLSAISRPVGAPMSAGLTGPQTEYLGRSRSGAGGQASYGSGREMPSQGHHSRDYRKKLQAKVYQ